MYLASLWGYWFKDMLILSDPLIVVHHIACMSSLVGVVFLQNLGSLGLFILGTATLEFGTLFYNLNCLLPSKRTPRYIYWTVMTLSNICAFTEGCVLLFFHGRIPFLVRIAYLIVISGLCLGRQREVILNYRSHHLDGMKEG
eukprot:TRINITY_DN5185_c0_g1_i3.p1 TRINITY_DN5185_c0_g1~~TRINITY_DN5185_c0_g1_i3.p1  ORF type:complete len:142 (-),score=15.53 TRINITY_DN5185_c0_g1_i3:195-620(-)